MTDEAKRHEELHQVAAVAAQRAAELVNAAALQAHQVTATAAASAKSLAESTRADMKHMQDDLKEIKVLLDSKFVTAEAFHPVKTLVYGMAGIILTSVVIALVALVVIKR